MKKNSKIYQLEMHALKKEGGLNSSKQLINGYDRWSFDIKAITFKTIRRKRD